MFFTLCFPLHFAKIDGVWDPLDERHWSELCYNDYISLPMSFKKKNLSLSWLVSSTITIENWFEIILTLKYFKERETHDTECWRVIGKCIIHNVQFNFHILQLASSTGTLQISNSNSFDFDGFTKSYIKHIKYSRKLLAIKRKRNSSSLNNIS